MDHEAQVPAAAGSPAPMVVSGSSFTSPVISSPALCSPMRPRANWWNDAPFRQNSRSTVASASDFNLPAACSPALAHRLQILQDKLSVPLALLAGMLFGATVTAALSLYAVHARGPAPASAATVAEPYAAAAPPMAVPVEYMASPALNNSCLIPNLAIPDGPRTFDACGFVVKSTDEVWNLRGNVDAAIDKYFHEDYVDAGSWGRRIIGKKALREAILTQMRAFPDIRAHITDCVCKGNDNDGYKCAMPDVLTGTNIGPSAYGPPTGRFARWTGLVQSFVKRNAATGQWQYVAEWGVHDEWALIQQLGLDFSRVPHPPLNSEPLHDCVPLLQLSSPAAKLDAQDEAMEEAHIRAKALSRQ